MVANVGHHNRVLGHGEEGVDARLAVSVVPVEQVHGSGNEEVVEYLPKFQMTTIFTICHNRAGSEPKKRALSGKK